MRHRGGRKDEKYELGTFFTAEDQRSQATCPKTHRRASIVGLLASDGILGQTLQRLCSEMLMLGTHLLDTTGDLALLAGP